VSFRLRIFVLVLVVAVTAIGATAYLTISLTTREAVRIDQARDKHEVAIVDEIRRYGVRYGQWSGVDSVVRDLSRATGLHIRVVARERNVVLTDSDNLNGRAAGPIQLLSRQADPVPALDPLIVSAADQLAMAAALTDPVDPSAPRQYDIGRRLRPDGTRLPLAPVPAIPADLLGPIPRAAPDTQAFHQLVQYRAALMKVRCMADHDAGTPALASADSPYLDDEQRRAEPACGASANNRVRDDEEWLEARWGRISDCRMVMTAFDDCLAGAFAEGALTVSAVPVEIFFGAAEDPDVAELGRPAGYARGGPAGRAGAERRRRGRADRALQLVQLDGRGPAAQRGTPAPPDRRRRARAAHPAVEPARISRRPGRRRDRAEPGAVRQPARGDPAAAAHPGGSAGPGAGRGR
jgi:two-component system sensor histidine kinase BaeS